MEDNNAERPAESGAMDGATLNHALEHFRPEQNLVAGMTAALVAALGGAALWAVITAATGYQIGWMAIGVGFIVGFAVRSAGKGIDNSFGVIGAVFALIGCALGNLFVIAYFISVEEMMGFFEVLTRLNPGIAIELMKATFSPMDLLFYGFAIYMGYRISFRQFTEEELELALKGRNGGYETA